MTISKTEMLEIVDRLNDMANKAYWEPDGDVRIARREVYAIACKIDMYVHGYIRPCEDTDSHDDWRPQVCEIKRKLRSAYTTAYGVCSSCGELVDAEGTVVTETAHRPSRYCPNCGAKIVGFA